MGRDRCGRDREIAFGLKESHPLLLVGIIGAIVDIGKRWIESDFAEPVEKVAEIALPFTKVRG